MDDFLPFGVQYYRAPTPFESDWKKDLRRIADCGFNVVKVWAQWRWNNPVEGSYDFNDIDQLMDICEKNGLKVIINIIYDVAPVWLYRKYPDCVMVTSTGMRVEPSTSACRQIGGVPGPCYHHGDADEEKLRFTREVVQKYARHPALYCWDLWNEPELRRGSELHQLVCYCHQCREAFISWLQRKYVSIRELNKIWSKNYACWDELELPRDARAFKDMIDWRLFFMDTLTEDLKRRIEIVKKIDNVHEVMVHPAYFDKISGCWDGYEMASMCDMFGGSTRDDPFYCNLYASYSPGKKVISSEVHAYGGFTLERSRVPDFNTFKSFILVPLAEGYKGFLYWQYRPEIIGKEAPMWGLTKLDGSDTEWLGYSVKINSALQSCKSIILNGGRKRAEIGIVSDIKNHLFNWCASYSPEIHESSVRGAFKLFYDLGVNASIVDIKQIHHGEIAHYKIIYYPFPYYMDSRTAEVLKKWVRDGGILISEAFFGSYNDDTGLHNIIVPGFGFDEVFGAREDRSMSAAEFHNAYDDFDSTGKVHNVDAEIEMDGNGGMLKGYYFFEEISPSKAEVLGRFKAPPLTGSPAVTVSAYGKGKAYWIGTLLAKHYLDKHIEENKDFICNLLKDAGIVPDVQLLTDARVRFDILGSGNEALLVIRNLSAKPAEIKFGFRGASYGRMEDLLDDHGCLFSKDDVFTLTMREREISLFKLD